MNDLQDRIETARARTLRWLDTMQAPDGVLRISAAHDERSWPGMLLPGTYNGVMCRHLLDGQTTDTGTLVAWLLSHRRPDGVFRILGTSISMSRTTRSALSRRSIRRRCPIWLSPCPGSIP
jgi:prenyltransferase beta subunit